MVYPYDIEMIQDTFNEKNFFQKDKPEQNLQILSEFLMKASFHEIKHNILQKDNLIWYKT